MKLVYFEGHVPNFGDELNPYLWPKLLPEGFLDGCEDELMLGIGSILQNKLPGKSRKFVLGSGLAYTKPPDINDGSWEIFFVRGPRTAASLGLPKEKAICDGAILLRAIELPPASASGDVAFMPHYESLDRGCWPQACRLAGIPVIDPTGPVDGIVSAIKGVRMLITEAMHGAIVADALRTPRVAADPINKHHHRKWDDWAESLGLTLRRNTLRPSSAMEFYVAVSGGRGDVGGRAGRWGRSPLVRPLDKALTHRAAEGLRRLARCEPQLSSDTNISRVTERATEAVDRFVKKKRREGVGSM